MALVVTLFGFPRRRARSWIDRHTCLPFLQPPSRWRLSPPLRRLCNPSAPGDRHVRRWRPRRCRRPHIRARRSTFPAPRDAAGAKIKGWRSRRWKLALEVLATAASPHSGRSCSNLADRTSSASRQIAARTEAGIRLGQPQASASTMRQMVLAEPCARRRNPACSTRWSRRGVSKRGCARRRSGSAACRQIRRHFQIPAPLQLAGICRPGPTDEALAILEEGQKELGCSADEVNYWANRAAYWLRRPSPARRSRWPMLLLPDIGKRRMNTFMLMPIFHFAWIRACARQGTGRAAEQRLLTAISAAEGEFAPSGCGPMPAWGRNRPWRRNSSGCWAGRDARFGRSSFPAQIVGRTRSGPTGRAVSGPTSRPPSRHGRGRCRLSWARRCAIGT